MFADDAALLHCNDLTCIAGKNNANVMLPLIDCTANKKCAVLLNKNQSAHQN